ncbi:PdaC/SigV domain-containing protein [Paenibacillus sp. YAF4_2]|uniref:PdaC/SigV domain-containing protein n=1 Tax=Paenibacillus sp. YAF4_2 TaxID=3233085 RepID=UPI003F9DA2A6
MKKPFKMLTIAVAGSCLLAFTPALAMAQETTVAPIVATSGPITAVPISATLPDTQAVKVTSNVIEETSELLTVKISVPVISGMLDTSYQDKLNTAIKENATKEIDRLKALAAEDKKAAEENDYPFHAYELNVSYELKADGSSSANGILSFTVATYEYTGGAHGGTGVEGFNILNGKEASKLTLEQALGEGGIAAANNAVRYTINKNPENFFWNAITTFKIDANHTYFIDGKGIVNLVFQQYEIAPYAGGIINIPVDETTTTGPSLTLSNKELTAGPNNTQLVPLRKTAEALGYKVTWSNKSQSAEVSRDAQWTSVTAGKNSYFINKMAPIKLGTAPSLIKGSLYVPITFFGDILKLQVNANSADGSVVVRG